MNVSTIVRLFLLAAAGLAVGSCGKPASVKSLEQCLPGWWEWTGVASCQCSPGEAGPECAASDCQQLSLMGFISADQVWSVTIVASKSLGTMSTLSSSPATLDAFTLTNGTPPSSGRLTFTSDGGSPAAGGNDVSCVGTEFIMGSVNYHFERIDSGVSDAIEAQLNAGNTSWTAVSF